MPGTGSEANPGRQTRTYCLGSEFEVALVLDLGAYWFAMTLTVVSRLHRHASPDSTSRVETVHPLGGGYNLFIITLSATALCPVGGVSPTCGMPARPMSAGTDGGDAGRTVFGEEPAMVSAPVSRDSGRRDPSFGGSVVYLLMNLPLGVLAFSVLVTFLSAGVGTAVVWV